MDKTNLVLSGCVIVSSLFAWHAPRFAVPSPRAVHVSLQDVLLPLPPVPYSGLSSDAGRNLAANSLFDRGTKTAAVSSSYQARREKSSFAEKNAVEAENHIQKLQIPVIIRASASQEVLPISEPQDMAQDMAQVTGQPIETGSIESAQEDTHPSPGPGAALSSPMPVPRSINTLEKNTIAKNTIGGAPLRSVDLASLGGGAHRVRERNR